MSRRDTLPDEIIDRIFARLLVRYQSQWVQSTAGIDVDAMRADWARELGMLTNSMIRYALENLPTDWPPNAGKFRQIAMSRPDYYAPVQLIEAPKVDPEKARPHLKKIRELVSGMRAQHEAGRTAWAQALERREAAGEKLTPAQRAAWRSALAETAHEALTGGGVFKPIPVEKLPPAMRAEYEAARSGQGQAGEA